MAGAVVGVARGADYRKALRVAGYCHRCMKVPVSRFSGCVRCRQYIADSVRGSRNRVREREAAIGAGHQPRRNS